MLCLARDPQARLRDVAQAVGITERAAQGIVNDLVAAGYVGRTRTGRRNEYTLDRRLQLRHPLEREHAVGELLDVLTPIRRPQESVPLGLTAVGVPTGSREPAGAAQGRPRAR